MQRSRRELILILGSITAFGPLATDMYLPALPTLERVFAATPSQVQLTLAAFFVGIALGQVVYGPITDRFGRRPPLYVGLLLFATASAGCALAPSIEALSAWRFVQALGSCAGGVISRAVVRDLFDPKESVRIFASLMLVMGVVPMLAPVLGGYILVTFGWSAIFLLMAAVAVVCLVAVHFRLPETRPPEYVRPLVLRGIVSGYARLLSHRHYLGCALTGSASMAGVFGYIAGAPHVFIEVHGVSPEHFGWFFGLNAFGFVMMAQVNGRLMRGFSLDAVVRAGSLVQALAGLTLLVMAKLALFGLAGIAVPLFVFIASLGFVLPSTAALAMAPHGENAGAASALMGTLNFTGGAFAVLAVGALHEPQTAVAMGVVVAVCGMLTFGFYRFLGRAT